MCGLFLWLVSMEAYGQGYMSAGVKKISLIVMEIPEVLFGLEDGSE